MWKTILYAHDFSECAAAVESTVVELAQLLRAGVVVCHVSELSHGLSADTIITPPGEEHSCRLGEFTLRSATARLDTIVARLRSHGVEACGAALLDPIAHGILRAAKEQRADVIVMGTHGRTGLEHLLLGSVAERVLRQADVPVLTLRTAAKKPRLREDEVLQDELDG